MGKKTIVVALTIVFLSSASYALDPLGPPKALLDKGQWSPSVEYAYSEIDVRFDDGTVFGNPTEDTSSKVRASKAYANLRYGVWEDVDAFGRLGLVIFDEPMLNEGDAGIAWGLGAAATLRDTEKLDWGVLAQFSHGESEAHSMSSWLESEIEAWSFQVAGGPTYQLRDDMLAYGGLFYTLFDGELDGQPVEGDLKGDDFVGIFGGIDWTVKENAHWAVEFQYAGSTIAITTGLRWFLE